GISARVVSQSNSNSLANARVTACEMTARMDSCCVVFRSPSNGINVQYRSSAGGSAQWPVHLSGGVPTYLQVGRVGNTFTAYTSTDGVSWTAIPGSSVTLSMSGSLLQGLAVTSHNSAALSTVTMDTVTVGTTQPPPPPPGCPSGWSCADVGSPTPAGSQSLSSGTWTIQAGGADIWGTSDQFHFDWQT